MSKAAAIPIGRLLAEFAVIVIGVLVALAVDRWVAAIDDAERHEIYLVALRSDFQANRAAATTRLRSERELEQLGRLLYGALLTNDEVSTPARVVLAAELSGYTVYESYSRGAWDNLALAGETWLTADPQLQIAVSEFYRLQESRQRLDQEFLEYVLSYRFAVRSALPPALRSEINLRFPGWAGDFTAEPLSYLRKVDLTQTLAGILEAEGLTEQLTDVLVTRDVGARFAQRDLDEIDRILGMIDEALGSP